MKNLTQKISIVALLLMASVTINAQNVGINENGAAPSNDALLDINSNVGANKGLLIPRVNIANLATAAPVTAPTTSLLVYNTNATTGLGYYYWDGAKWVKFTTGGDDWKIIGNANITGGTHFLGTTNNVQLDFRTSNLTRFSVKSNDYQVFAGGNGTASLPFYSWSSDPDIGMYRVTTNTLGFATTGIERMRINAIGNIGIGVTPNGNNNMLTVQQSTTTGTAIYGSTTANSNWVTIEGSSTSTTQGTGVSGIGYTGVSGSTTTASGWAGYFDYDTYIDWMFYTGATLVSDRRLKTNINEIENAMGILAQLNPVKYNKASGVFLQDKSTKGTPYVKELSDFQEYGFIAQEVEKVLPELVKSKDMNMTEGGTMDVKGVNYTMLIPILTKGLLEQQKMIEAQNAKIDELQKMVLELKNK